jgi:predicted metal-dependent hydrolase
MELDYKLIYSHRKGITVTVERDRSVVVRAPEGIDAAKVKKVIESKKLWIYEKLRHSQKYGNTGSKKEFVSGETIPYLGRNYRLEVHLGDKEEIRFVGKFVVTGVSADRASRVFKEWYIQEAREHIIPRVEWHARNLGVGFNRVLVSDLSFRWGSCTPKDNLNFNWKLIKAPMFVVDYVIVHELTHLLEHNHTDRFWGIVRGQLAGYLKAKNWLRENGELLEGNF